MPRSIKGLRCDLNMTQKELADKLGYNLSTYQRYERLETEVPFKFVLKLADLCKIEDLREIKAS